MKNGIYLINRKIKFSILILALSSIAIPLTYKSCQAQALEPVEFNVADSGDIFLGGNNIFDMPKDTFEPATVNLAPVINNAPVYTPAANAPTFTTDISSPTALPSQVTTGNSEQFLQNVGLSYDIKPAPEPANTEISQALFAPTMSLGLPGSYTPINTIPEQNIIESSAIAIPANSLDANSITNQQTAVNYEFDQMKNKIETAITNKDLDLAMKLTNELENKLTSKNNQLTNDLANLNNKIEAAPQPIALQTQNVAPSIPEPTDIPPEEFKKMMIEELNTYKGTKYAPQAESILQQISTNAPPELIQTSLDKFIEDVNKNVATETEARKNFAAGMQANALSQTTIPEQTVVLLAEPQIINNPTPLPLITENTMENSNDLTDFNNMLNYWQSPVQQEPIPMISASSTITKIPQPAVIPEELKTPEQIAEAQEFENNLYDWTGKNLPSTIIETPKAEMQRMAQTDIQDLEDLKKTKDLTPEDYTQLLKTELTGLKGTNYWGSASQIIEKIDSGIAPDQYLSDLDNLKSKMAVNSISNLVENTESIIPSPKTDFAQEKEPISQDTKIRLLMEELVPLKNTEHWDSSKEILQEIAQGVPPENYADKLDALRTNVANTGVNDFLINTGINNEPMQVDFKDAMPEIPVPEPIPELPPLPEDFMIANHS